MGRKDHLLQTFLYAVSFLGQTAISVVNLGMVFFLKNTLGLRAELVGIFAASCSVTYCISLILGKHIVTSLKPLHALGISTAGMIACTAGIVLLGHPAAALVLYLCFGFFMALFWPPIMGWISRGRESRDLGRSISRFNVSWGIGIIVGPYVAGLISEVSPARALWAAAGIFAFVCVIAAIASTFIADVRTAPSRKTLKRTSIPADASTPLRYLCWVGLFTGYFIFGISMNVFPMFALDVLAYPESRIGFLLFLRGVTSAFGFYLLGKTHYWHGSVRSIFTLQAITSLLGIFLALSLGYAGLIVFMLIFGLCFSHLYSFSIYHGVSGSVDREFRMALHEAVLTSGIFLGSSLGGVLYAQAGFQWTMVLSAAVGFLGLCIQVALYRSRIKTDTAL